MTVAEHFLDFHKGKPQRLKVVGLERIFGNGRWVTFAHCFFGKSLDISSKGLNAELLFAGFLLTLIFIHLINSFKLSSALRASDDSIYPFLFFHLLFTYSTIFFLYIFGCIGHTMTDHGFYIIIPNI